MAVVDVCEPGGIEELYATHAHRLERIVRTGVRAPQAVVEDACQFAWGSLVDHASQVRRESALAWLATTAVREALRLLRSTGREASLEYWLDVQPSSSPEQLAEQRERLAEVRLLPARQQRMIWLQALGLSYGEIAARQGCTVRTVERQLLRGKRALRELACRE